MPDFTSTVDIARPAGDQRDALQWARVVWEDAPPPMRAFLRTGWLGLGLTTRLAPDRVLGWTIASATPDRVVLEAPFAADGHAQHRAPRREPGVLDH